MKRNRFISAVCVLSLALSLCAGGCSEKKEEATSDIKTETQKVKKAEFLYQKSCMDTREMKILQCIKGLRGKTQTISRL